MAESKADPKSRWMPGVLLVVGFFALAALAVTMTRMISPSTGSLVPHVDAAAWDHAGKARFAEAASVWSALMVGVHATLGACVAVSWRVILRRRCDPPIGWITLLCVPIVACGAFLLVESPRDTAPPLASLAGHRLFTLDIRVLIHLTNAATVLAIASLFSASAMILVRGESTPDDDTDDDALARDLKGLLAVGAIATVVGVLEIGAVHRLPAAATTGSAIDVTGRARLRTDLETLLRDVKTPDAPPGTPDHAALLKLGLTDMLGADAASALAGELLPSTANAQTLRNAVITTALEARDERLREANAKSLSDLADHAASSSGFIFTIALAAMYIPTALSISRRTGASGAASLALTGGPPTGGGDTDPPARKPVTDLLVLSIRILTALSPLLAGIFAELFKHVAALFPGAA